MDDDLITERRSVAFPQVFGYLRHITGGVSRHTALVDCLTEYCDRHELTLCGVFTERDATVIIRSPAFVGLLDALDLPDAYGAVVPSISHLGPKGLGAERKRQIATAGARLIVVRPLMPTTRSSSSLGASHSLRPQGDV